jgi:hypothetical protein
VEVNTFTKAGHRMGVHKFIISNFSVERYADAWPQLYS